jgi:hypothetical protein
MLEGAGCAVHQSLFAQPGGVYLGHAALLNTGVRSSRQWLARIALIGVDPVVLFRVAVGMLAQKQAYTVPEGGLADDEGELPQNARGLE